MAPGGWFAERVGRRGTAVAVAVVLAAAVVIAAVTAIAVLRGGSEGPDTPVAGPTASRTSSSSPSTTRTTATRTAPGTVATAERGAVCSARVINTDLGYPRSGARMADCEGGWAVMGSEISGDPFWVRYSGGRWRHAPDVSIYIMTCPDEAIAKGVPPRMAHRHLTTCSTSTSSSTAPSTTTRTTPSTAETPARTSPPSTTRTSSSVPTTPDTRTTGSTSSRSVTTSAAAPTVTGTRGDG